MAIAERNFVSVNGIAIGEETKGNTVQSIARELQAHTIWRSGGWQSGHHIIHDDGREMGFSFYGAGTFDGSETYLKHMVISPDQLFEEAMRLGETGVENPLSLITIDQDCISSTPYHRSISRLREILRGPNKKGTVGTGVGEAIKDSLDPSLTLRAGDFSDRAKVESVTENIRLAKLAAAEKLLAAYPGPIPQEALDELSVLKNTAFVMLNMEACYYLSGLVNITDDRYLEDLLERPGNIVNEVSHGLLHHPWFGFVPHITQIDPSGSDVLTTVRDHNYEGNISRIGVVRSYITRQGAGPLPSFNQEMSDTLIETHNNSKQDWLGPFRTGNFDIVALNYALSIGSDVKAVDGLVVSYLDLLKGKDSWEVCVAYEYDGKANDLETYFYMNGNQIIGIKKHPDTRNEAHYNYQLRLTELIKNCKPVLRTISKEPGKTLEEVFLSFIEERLEVPVVGKAYGPMVKDRTFLTAFRQIINR